MHPVNYFIMPAANPSTASKALLAIKASFAPAIAKSGLPPPLPPATAATAETSLPASTPFATASLPQVAAKGNLSAVYVGEHRHGVGCQIAYFISHASHRVIAHIFKACGDNLYAVKLFCRRQKLVDLLRGKPCGQLFVFPFRQLSAPLPSARILPEAQTDY